MSRPAAKTVFDIANDPGAALAHTLTATSAAPLPQPMLARSGQLPTRGDFASELKWDGFRAIVSTEGELRVP